MELRLGYVPKQRSAVALPRGFESLPYQQTPFRGLRIHFFAFASYPLSLRASFESTATSLTWFDILWHCLLPEGIQNLLLFCFSANFYIFPVAFGR